jgi:hypothetical protein
VNNSTLRPDATNFPKTLWSVLAKNARTIKIAPMASDVRAFGFKLLDARSPESGILVSKAPGLRSPESGLLGF